LALLFFSSSFTAFTSSAAVYIEPCPFLLFPDRLQLFEASWQSRILQCEIVNPTPYLRNEDEEILCVWFITFDLSGIWIALPVANLLPA
jgi:hypothetical protein